MVTRDPEGVCMTPTIVNGKRNGVFWGNEMVMVYRNGALRSPEMVHIDYD
ncbi:hypothetical protein LPYR103PRE_11310 [Segatella asaccharophila]